MSEAETTDGEVLRAAAEQGRYAAREVIYSIIAEEEKKRRAQENRDAIFFAIGMATGALLYWSFAR